MTLFDLIEDTRCRYGTPDPGDPTPRPCSAMATHRAVWAKDGATGGIDCCRSHANYYATAWVPFSIGMGFSEHDTSDAAAWIEVLP